MKKLTFLMAFCCAFQCLYSQQTIKGTITDSSEAKNLFRTVIAVLRKADSVLISYTRSNEQGNFTIGKLLPGKLILMVTHPRYADYVDEIEIKDAGIDLGNIFMTLKSQLLQEVIVTNSSAIRMKGDTTEYKVDSFHLKEGATVEDLLKKLPGIQVDKNGKITAQGEAVQKVLVDGEEFFSDDPTVVTQNLLSDAVDKVQVYDKKSDQATFTGIDDGQKSKTIDLKLKESRKKGYFGKLELGSDGEKYWNNSVMVNAFKAKRKFSAFGVMSNTGKTGLDWNESREYGGDQNSEVNYDDGEMYVVFNGGDEFENGNFYGQGLPKGWNGGLLYSNKWNEDKIKLNTSYQYKKLNTEGSGSVQSKYILPDTLYYQNEKGNNYSSRIRNTVNGVYEYQLDSSSSLKVTGKGYTGKSLSMNTAYSESLDRVGKLVNSSERRTSSDMDNKNINVSALYRKKFKKPGRTISLNLSQNYLESQSTGFLNASYNYYDEFEEIKQQESADQQKLRDNRSSAINSRLIYTEPLSKRAILEFNYGLINNFGRSGITTLGKAEAANEKYDEVVDSLTNDYSLNVLTNSGGINYRYSKPKKLNFSFGGNVSRADFVRKDVRTDTAVSYSFINVFPKASINITLPGAGSLRLSYNGSTAAPSVEQLQPIKDNTNQLSQRIGNPDLKQAFRNRFSLSFNSYKLLSERQIFGFMSYTAASNEFSNNEFVDELGRRLSQPVNVDGNRSLNGFFGYWKKIKILGMRLGVDVNPSYVQNANFINNLQNLNKIWIVSAGPRLMFNKDKKYDITIAPRLRHVSSNSSIRPDETTKYMTQDHYVDASVFLPFKIELNSDCTFSIRQKTDAFDQNTNAIRWNTRIDKKIMKNNSGIIRFAAFDLLDQNIGFERDVQTNFISERTYDTFRRYFMLSFLYNFNKNGKPQQ